VNQHSQRNSSSPASEIKHSSGGVDQTLRDRIAPHVLLAWHLSV
jgi:hypothetical protein